MSTPSVNPYASPRLLSEPTETAYFTTASKRLSIREYWWISKNPIEFALGVLFKLLQVNLPATFGIAHPRNLQVLSMEDLPVRARRRMAADVNAAVVLGFQPCLYYTIPHIGPISGCAIAMLSGDGTTLLGIAYAHSTAGIVEQEMCKFSFSSNLHDGQVIATLGDRPDLDSPPEVSREMCRKRPMSEVFDRHRQRLREFGSPAIVIRDPAEAERIIRQREERVFDYHCGRKLFVPLSEQDMLRLSRGTDPTKRANLTVSANPGMDWIGTLSWLVLALGLYLFFQGPAVNPAQWMFRVALLAIGVVGVIASSFVIRRSKPRGEDNDAFRDDS